MKRNKPSEKPSGRFHNTPFKALTGFTPDRTAGTRPVQKPSAPPVRDEDGADLFLRSVGDVRKLGPPPSAPKKMPAAPRANPGRDEEDRELFLRAMKTMGPDFRSDMREPDEEGPRRVSPSGRMKRLKQGAIRIAEELDLHGFLKDEALVRLDQFITSSFARGLQAVLVITGKGLNSPEGPVLPGAVSAWLRGPGKGMVAEFAPAPRDKGGSGALVVFLKRRAG